VKRRRTAPRVVGGQVRTAFAGNHDRGLAGRRCCLRPAVQPGPAGDHYCVTRAAAAAAGSPDANFFREFGLRGAGAAELVEVLLPLAVLTRLATDRRLWRARPFLLTATILAASLGALFRHLLRAAAYQLA
jgi:hypothetical protein